jgi:hypothetical protein
MLYSIYYALPLTITAIVLYAVLTYIKENGGKDKQYIERDSLKVRLNWSAVRPFMQAKWDTFGGSVKSGATGNGTIYNIFLIIFISVFAISWMIWEDGFRYRIPLAVKYPLFLGVIPYVGAMVTFITARSKKYKNIVFTVTSILFLIVGILAFIVMVILSFCEICAESLSGCPG